MFADAGADLDSGVLQFFGAAGVGVLGGVDGGDDDFGDFCGDDGVGAGTCFAVMCAGFESDVHFSALGVCAEVFAIGEGVNFGVVAAEFFVEAFSDNLICLYNDTANRRIGLNGAYAPLGELEGHLHILHSFTVHKLTSIRVNKLISNY